MKFITITPTKYMCDAFFTSDITLVLAHLVNQSNYCYNQCLGFKDAGGKIILDNSYYELRENMSLKVLIDTAKAIKADALVLPDLPISNMLTFTMNSYINIIKASGYKGKLMATVFADNESFLHDIANFQYLNDIEGIDIIAIPYVFRKSDELRRPEFLDMVEKVIGVKNIKKQVHLFGCNSFENIKKERRPWITSIDGSMPWKCGYYNKMLPISEKEEPKRPKDYFDIEKVDMERSEMIAYNCEVIKQECEQK